MFTNAATATLFADPPSSSMPTVATTATIFALGLLSSMLTDARAATVFAAAPYSSMLTYGPTEERIVQGSGGKQRIGRDTYEPLCTMHSVFFLSQRHFGSLPPARS